MKTTLDLDDELLAEAKAIAARRRTTLKAIVEHALRREIQPAEPENPDPGKYEVGPFGILSIKRTRRKPKAKEIQHAIDHQYDEEDARVTAIATGKA
jgi:hypothetical protein